MKVRAVLTVGAALALVATGVAPASALSSTPLACAQPNGRVDAIAIYAGVAYIGGQFTSVQDKSGAAHARGHLAAVNTSTCELTSWTADTNGEVLSLAALSNVIFVGGSYTTIKGVNRSRLAGVTTAGAVTGFNPSLDGDVNALAIFGSGLYGGGKFKTASGSPRKQLAAWATATGNLSAAWTPSATGGAVQSISTDSSRIYVGGAFTAVDGVTAGQHLAAVNTSNGGYDTTFKPNAGFPVFGVVNDSKGVYVAGGGGGGRVGRYSRTGALLGPLAYTDGDVQTVAVSAGTLYAGGHFANFCNGGRIAGSPPQCVSPIDRKKVIQVSATSGNIGPFAPQLNSALGVFSSAVDPATGRLWMGGDFTTVNDAPRAHLAVFA